MNKITLSICTILLFSFITLKTQSQESKIDKATIATENFIKEQNIPGMSISVSENGNKVWSEGFGFSNIEKKTKVNPSKTQFRIASISKTLTALAIAKLVDDEKIKLDASLYNYVPDFPKKKYDFAIRQIGGHLAGIRHYSGREFLLNKKMSIVEGLNIFKDSELLSKPGTKFKYSTYGWNLLSVVIQKASQEDYFEYMSNTIFFPLKMNKTVLDKSNVENSSRTKFYIKRKGVIKEGPLVNNEFKAAGGGFISTSEDLLLFGNQFINPQIISKESLAELIKPQKTSNGKNTNYGIGIGVRKIKNNTLKLSHSGGGIGASSNLLIYPEKGIVISILTNLSGVKMTTYIKELENIFID
jgi:CubicO group peptidase (beta-lactamase class C family)